MPPYMFWTQEISHTHLWMPHFHTKWPQTIRNDTVEAHTHSATTATMNASQIKKVQLHHSIKPGKEMILVDHLSRFTSHKHNMAIEINAKIQQIHFNSDGLNHMRCHQKRSHPQYSLQAHPQWLAREIA